MQAAGLAALDINDCFNQALQAIFPTQGLNPHLWSLTALASGFFTTSATWEAILNGLDNNACFNQGPARGTEVDQRPISGRPSQAEGAGENPLEVLAGRSRPCHQTLDHSAKSQVSPTCSHFFKVFF